MGDLGSLLLLRCWLQEGPVAAKYEHRVFAISMEHLHWLLNRSQAIGRMKDECRRDC